MAEKHYHAIVRTSPKGQDFIGTCARCGKENLKSGDALKECENIRGISNDEALIEQL